MYKLYRLQWNNVMISEEKIQPIQTIYRVDKINHLIYYSILVEIILFIKYIKNKNIISKLFFNIT